MKPADLYVLSLPATLAKHRASADPQGPIRPPARVYLRAPPVFKPSQCTPLFLSAFTRRDARCCIHTHSPHAVLITLLLEQEEGGQRDEFRINNIEQIKGFARGYPHPAVGNLGYHDTLRIPVIENTAHEEDLTEFMEAAMDKYPDAYAVLVRRHGVYVWGNSVQHAKTQCERYVLEGSWGCCLCDISTNEGTYSLDYLFQLAVEMKKLGIPWISDIAPTIPTRGVS